jgi:hypothetical protein
MVQQFVGKGDFMSKAVVELPFDKKVDKLIGFNKIMGSVHLVQGLLMMIFAFFVYPNLDGSGTQSFEINNLKQPHVSTKHMSTATQSDGTITSQFCQEIGAHFVRRPVKLPT